jgi:amidase
VACGLADFALGTDTGGSVRIPASNCGLWGFRPTHGRVSVAGVMPFSPGYDTVGVFTRTPDVLAKAAGVLLACDSSTDEPANVYLVQDAFRLADADVQAALAEPVNRLKARYGNRVTEVTLEAIIGDPAAANHMTWNETYCVIQWAEVESVLGGWIADRKPRFGPISAANFQLPRSLDRRRVPAVIGRRERYAQRLNAFLGPRDLLCMPTAPAVAPRKNSGLRRDAGPEGYFPRTLGLTALSGVGRLPQVSIPGAEVGGVPIGLSLLAASGNDGFLLGVATRSG